MPLMISRVSEAFPRNITSPDPNSYWYFNIETIVIFFIRFPIPYAWVSENQARVVSQKFLFAGRLTNRVLLALV